MKRGSSTSYADLVRRVTEMPASRQPSDTADIDRHRWTIFPNNVREWRRRRGYPKLLAFAQRVHGIPYIRLSKIERGEVVARADELVAIAAALDVTPVQLLIDIDDPSFDIARWAAEFQDPATFDLTEDTFAVLLAAALRARRETEERLSIAVVEAEYGIPPVILSRLENAHKTLDRWNEATLASLCRLFGVRDARALREAVYEAHKSSGLTRHLELVANPRLRIEKTRTKVGALRAELEKGRKPHHGRDPAKAPPPRREAAAPAQGAEPPAEVIDAIQASDMAMVRLVPVFGAPLGEGLIARVATGDTVEAPRSAGPRAYGLRVCRPTLGAGLPGRATVVVDPDRFPSSGGLAVVREPDGLRLLSITFDREGHMIGYSQNPDREVPIDALDPADIATVISAIFD